MTTKKLANQQEEEKDKNFIDPTVKTYNTVQSPSSRFSCWIALVAGVCFGARRSASERTAARCVDGAVLAQRRRRRACLTFSRWRRGGGASSRRRDTCQQTRRRLELCASSPLHMSTCSRSICGASWGGDVRGRRWTGWFILPAENKLESSSRSSFLFGRLLERTAAAGGGRVGVG